MSTSTSRVRAYRDRRRRGVWCVTPRIYEPDIEGLIQLKYLEADARQDLGTLERAVRPAVKGRCTAASSVELANALGACAVHALSGQYD